MVVQAVMTVNEVRNEKVNIKILAYCLLCSGPLHFPLHYHRLKWGINEHKQDTTWRRWIRCGESDN